MLEAKLTLYSGFLNISRAILYVKV